MKASEGPWTQAGRGRRLDVVSATSLLCILKPEATEVQSPLQGLKSATAACVTVIDDINMSGP